MLEKQYKIRKAEPRNQLSEIDLFPVIPHNGKNLDVVVFGPNTYKNNLTAMRENYFHSEQLPNISNPATTSESVSIAVYDFENIAKPKIFDPRWLQAGYMFKAQEGVFLNPRDKQGNFTNDENILKSFIKSKRKVNEIYLLDNELAFVPYETFKQEVQDSETFARSGLARGLEYTSETKAIKLKKISSKKNYPEGVNVFGFNRESALRVVTLYSDRDLDYSGLIVGGSYWIEGSGGYAFGVLKKINNSGEM